MTRRVIKWIENARRKYPDMTLGEVIVAAFDDDMFGFSIERFIKTGDQEMCEQLKRFLNK
jgi:TusA-related sulfurtransferase